MNYLQKVCDIYDFFDPETDTVITNILKTRPFGSRRAWEFAMIYRTLSERGKINPASRGLAMGAGTERLIYAIAPRVAHTAVTDLYTPDSSWIGVRTDSPLDLVLSRAPWPIDEGKISAAAMDMRNLDFEEDSFDFCWSTGAIEHIGSDQDFAQHFSEVERVLKPGGVYVLTTAVTFNGATERIPHNYYFDPQHLLDLAHTSPLHPDPVFDCTISEHLFNHPHPEHLEDFGFGVAGKFSKPIISHRRGLVITANSLVLTKDRSRPKARPFLLNFGETQQRVLKEAERFTKALWSTPKTVELKRKGLSLATPACYFGRAKMLAEFYLSGPMPADIQCVVEWRQKSANYTWHKLNSGSLKSGKLNHAFKTEEDKIYRLRIVLPRIKGEPGTKRSSRLTSGVQDFPVILRIGRASP